MSVQYVADVLQVYRPRFCFKGEIELHSLFLSNSFTAKKSSNSKRSETLHVHEKFA